MIHFLYYFRRGNFQTRERLSLVANAMMIVAAGVLSVQILEPSPECAILYFLACVLLAIWHALSVALGRLKVIVIPDSRLTSLEHFSRGMTRSTTTWISILRWVGMAWVIYEYAFAGYGHEFFGELFLPLSFVTFASLGILGRIRDIGDLLYSAISVSAITKAHV